MSWLAPHLIRGLERFLAVNLLVIVIIVVAQVVLRYCFSSSITGANEAITMLFIYSSALGAAVAIGRQEHITITVATDCFSSRVRGVANTLSILGVAILNAVMLIYSVGWIRTTGRYLMPTTELPRLVVQASVPLGCGLAVVLCLDLMMRASKTGASEESCLASDDRR